MRRFPWRPADIIPGRGDRPERFTAGGFLPRGGAILLERRPPDSRVYPNVWDTPGGHVEPGETPEAALERELREELGVAPVRFRLGMVQDDREPLSRRFYRHFVYVVAEWEGEPRSREDREIRWFEPGEALALPDLNPLAGCALQEFLAKGWLEDGAP